jgi:hypothetical protein
VVASALGHSNPAVTHAHYIEPSTARRARTRRVVDRVAPEMTLRAVGDAPANHTPRTRRKRAAGTADAASEPSGSAAAWETGNET